MSISDGSHPSAISTLENPWKSARPTPISVCCSGVNSASKAAATSLDIGPSASRNASANPSAAFCRSDSAESSQPSSMSSTCVSSSPSCFATAKRTLRQ
ncbi:hypothetical protein YM304_34290 [Ilumatobacter coccineus YM16-304]|uniref:Uncharacterized protein n=1 Tax=Ilumatobacter coccineus (strain NBRC 103263 / KCTC 29153 / YM16-304) TaxID=1313172 RepID=A0A6C7EBQ3_ILUCY|nr:hypothetical protein YM304_34290 [Ilumatobacter coccineus YM16-304]